MNWRELDTAHTYLLPSPDEHGLNIHVRGFTSSGTKTPTLFVHGATYGSRMYDIPVQDMSWLKYCSKQGNPAYAIDIRGYGKSTSCSFPEVNEPYATAHHAVQDIDLAVNWLRNRYNIEQVNLVGGSWGSITSSIYASTVGRNKIASLVLYAPIFSAKNSLWQKLLADPENTANYCSKLGYWRLVNLSQTKERWDEEIPAGENWRDNNVLEVLVQSSIEDASGGQSASGFVVPNGTLLDLWQVFGEGRSLYDPELINCPVLLLRGSGDLTSTREDSLDLFDRILTPQKRYVEIAGGGHFISAEYRATTVFKTVGEYLNEVSS